MLDRPVSRRPIVQTVAYDGSAGYRARALARYAAPASSSPSGHWAGSMAQRAGREWWSRAAEDYAGPAPLRTDVAFGKVQYNQSFGAMLRLQLD
jgi:hypothetical protein